MRNFLSSSFSGKGHDDDRVLRKASFRGRLPEALHPAEEVSGAPPDRVPLRRQGAGGSQYQGRQPADERGQEPESQNAALYVFPISTFPLPNFQLGVFPVPSIIVLLLVSPLGAHSKTACLSE